MKTTYFALLCILAAPMTLANAAITETPACPEKGLYDEKTNSCHLDSGACPPDYKDITVTIESKGEKKTIKKCVTCPGDYEWHWTHQKCEPKE
jgi:hypothetical protein